jgi:hypothetical protein
MNSSTCSDEIEAVVAGLAPRSTAELMAAIAIASCHACAENEPCSCSVTIASTRPRPPGTARSAATSLGRDSRTTMSLPGADIPASEIAFVAEPVARTQRTVVKRRPCSPQPLPFEYVAMTAMFARAASLAACAIRLLPSFALETTSALMPCFFHAATFDARRCDARRLLSSSAHNVAGSGFARFSVTIRAPLAVVRMEPTRTATARTTPTRDTRRGGGGVASFFRTRRRKRVRAAAPSIEP